MIVLLSPFCRKSSVQSLQSREFCGQEHCCFDCLEHVPFFNFAKVWAGFSENVFCGNSSLETLLIVKWSPVRVDLRGWIYSLGGSGYKVLSSVSLRESTSGQLFLRLSLCMGGILALRVVGFHTKRSSLYQSLHFSPWIPIQSIIWSHLFDCFCFLPQQKMRARLFIPNMGWVIGICYFDINRVCAWFVFYWALVCKNPARYLWKEI